MPKAYKVVRVRQDGTMWSCFVTDRYAHEYALNKLTVPMEGCGALAVFRTIYAAKSYIFDYFCNISKIMSILEVEYDVAERKECYTPDWSTVLILDKNHFPYGTLLASSVTPLRVVRDAE